MTTTSTTTDFCMHFVDTFVDVNVFASHVVGICSQNITVDFANFEVFERDLLELLKHSRCFLSGDLGIRFVFNKKRDDQKFGDYDGGDDYYLIDRCLSDAKALIEAGSLVIIKAIWFYKK
ncbi:MAG: hypothetical protein IM488_18245 [Microcystis sp. M025S2]|uniref:hypothetical protein n=1 Tax=Microcystis sp. M025S2 TaxID=2771161 RepID=UPI00258CB3BC|nr:hypothetical protein [Microcystis sp. M025S2]MCA2711269.1 hypothetical protein [Microcystis sp. M025S2]